MIIRHDGRYWPAGLNRKLYCLPVTFVWGRRLVFFGAAALTIVVHSELLPMPSSVWFITPLAILTALALMLAVEGLRERHYVAHLRAMRDDNPSRSLCVACGHEFIRSASDEGAVCSECGASKATSERINDQMLATRARFPRPASLVDATIPIEMLFPRR